MKSQNIVILTGAGISAESGLKTFRDSGGLWENHKIEDVATPEGFAENPNLVYEFYNQRRRQLASVQPNQAHIALANLEKHWVDDFLLVTQNVDDLHSRAGSGTHKDFIHMHGELKKARCNGCDSIHHWEEDLNSLSACSHCNTVGKLRPHIVWFGEMPLSMDLIYERLRYCDIFIAIGTSGKVYPAAGFVDEANRYGARTIEINLESSDTCTAFDEVITGKASVSVPELYVH